MLLRIVARMECIGIVQTVRPSRSAWESLATIRASLKRSTRQALKHRVTLTAAPQLSLQ